MSVVPLCYLFVLLLLCKQQWKHPRQINQEPAKTEQTHGFVRVSKDTSGFPDMPHFEEDVSGYLW